MKFMRTTLFLTLTVMLAGAAAFAQSSTNGVPGLTDYASFSRFIAERNIFDVNRQPHHGGSHRPAPRPRTYSASAPAFSLVGTMSYEKGTFAFFNGNNDDLKKALLVSGKIADYTVTKIDYGRVTLAATNQSQTVEMKVGDVMREENGGWQMTGPGELSVTGNSASTNHSDNESAPATSSSDHGAAPSASEANDILKRLMERRKQENQ